MKFPLKKQNKKNPQNLCNVADEVGERRKNYPSVEAQLPEKLVDQGHFECPAKVTKGVSTVQSSHLTVIPSLPLSPEVSRLLCLNILTFNYKIKYLHKFMLFLNNKHIERRT